MKHPGFILYMLSASLAGCCIFNPPFVIPPTPVSVPDPPESSAELPVSFDLNPVLAGIENTEHGHDWTGAWNMNGDFGYKWKWSRTPFSFKLSGDSLITTCNLYYWVQFCVLIGHWHKPIDTEENTVPITFTTHFAWKSNWSVGANTQVSARLPDVALNKVREYASMFDTAVENSTAKVSYLAVDTWTKGSQPVQIYDTPQTWLSLNPERAYATKFTSQNNILSSSFGLIARPKVSFGVKPPPSTTPFPPLTIEPSSGGKIFVNLEATLLYSEADRQLAVLKGQKYTSAKPVMLTRSQAQQLGLDVSSVGENQRLAVPGYIIIKDISITGGGNTALLTVTVSGFPFSGTIYFVGSLNYDADRLLLTVKNLNYKTASNVFFDLISDWVLHGPFLQKLNDAAQWDMAPNINTATQSLEQGFRAVTPDYRLKVDSLNPVGVYSTENSFLTVVEFVGSIDSAQVKNFASKPKRVFRVLH